jgi:type II secretion system protein J
MRLYPMKPFMRKKRYAFTLLEILVAMSIILLILAAVYGSYRAMAESISHCRPASILEQKANLFLLRLTRELRCCYAGAQKQTDDDTPAPFTGEEVYAGETFLQFVTSSLTSPVNKKMGGLAIISYKLDSSGTVLLQNVRKYTGITKDDDKNDKWSAALSSVKAISCEYLRDGKWQKDWRFSEEGILPQAVKVSLVLENDEAGPVSFESCASIMCAGLKTPDSEAWPTAAHLSFDRE